jgi:metal-responsive CopG/Arc/MetJ family transcriptional regulator
VKLLEAFDEAIKVMFADRTDALLELMRTFLRNNKEGLGCG